MELFKQRNWNSANGTVHVNDFTTSTYNGALSQQPQYLIEEVIFGERSKDTNAIRPGAGGSSKPRVFLVTGKSPSGDGRTIALVQSMFTAVISSSSSN